MHKIKKKKRDPFSSNAVRLSNKEILVTAIFTIVIVLFAIPCIWSKMEKIDTSGQFRIATKYRADYWLYQHWVDHAVKKHPVLFLGDSVVWGMYVDNNNTIPAKINKALGKDVVANLAIDGLHSIAAKGLLENYASSIENKKVILHYNPLWMQSRITDLSYTPVEKTISLDDDEADNRNREPQINHPRLIPQFSYEITAYNKKFSERAGVLRERYIPFFALQNHLRLTFFDNDDFNQWIIDHPHENPLSKISLKVDACERNKNKNRTLDWRASGITKQNWQWLELEDSLQWKAFQQIIELLRKRNNELCVMIGPINPYILTPESLKLYRDLQKKICLWLKSQKIEYVLINDMPSTMYADASHPLAKGYDLITKQLLQEKILKDYQKK
ncbi:MAG: SGNH/GDSL hydrolase family protein [Victivallales bacterium]|nr:SGNH/GDSL hydrolase family protein [Victivallales bacterium]